MIVVECTPYEKRIRKAVSMDNGKIVCTVNSFTSDEMKRHDAAKGTITILRNDMILLWRVSALI